MQQSESTDNDVHGIARTPIICEQINNEDVLMQFIQNVNTEVITEQGTKQTFLKWLELSMDILNPNLQLGAGEDDL